VVITPFSDASLYVVTFGLGRMYWGLRLADMRSDARGGVCSVARRLTVALMELRSDLVDARSRVKAASPWNTEIDATETIL